MFFYPASKFFFLSFFLFDGFLVFFLVALNGGDDFIDDSGKVAGSEIGEIFKFGRRIVRVLDFFLSEIAGVAHYVKESGGELRHIKFAQSDFAANGNVEGVVGIEILRH